MHKFKPSRQFITFLTVGVLNTLIDLVVFLLLAPHMSLVFAAIISSTCGMTFSFLVNGRYTFKSSGFTWRKVSVFAGLNMATLWVLQPILILLGVEFFSVYNWEGSAMLTLVKLSATAVCVIVNFYAYRHWVWPESK